MSSRWPGGVVSPIENVPKTTIPYCSGIWTMEQAAYWIAQGQWPNGPSDPNFENVTLLLNGDGTNGAQNNTFLDSSTNNFTITRNGNTTQGSFSPYGSNWSNYFPAGGNYSLTTPASSNTSLGSGDFTIEGWVFTNSFGAFYNMLVCKWDFPNKEWYLNFTASSITFGLSTNGVTDSAAFTVSTTVPLNAWNHIAVSRSGSNLYIFLNGTLISTQSITQTFFASSQVVAIGNFPSSGISDTGMRGYVSNVRLVKGTALYTATFTPSTTPLTAVSGTQLLTCQSNRFLDNSSNGFAVTATSSNSVQRFSPFNPTAPYSTSVIGGSGYFDGSGDYLVTTPDSSTFNFDTGDFTIECWYYMTIRNTNNYIFDMNDNGTRFQIFSNNLYMLPASGNSLQTALGCVPNTWVHVAMVRQSGTLYGYVNGVSFGNTSNSSNLTDSRVALGQYGGGGINFNGYISNFRIVKGSAVYPNGTTFTPPTSPVTDITNTIFLTNFTNAGIPDLAMQNNLETVGNAQVSTSVKKYGTASIYQPNSSTSDYLYINNNQNLAFGTGDFTIEAWVNSSNVSFASQKGWLQLSTVAGGFSTNTNNGLWILFGNTAAGKIQVSVNNSDIFSNTTVSANTWNHIAVTRNAGTVRLFVNGNLEGSNTNTANLTCTYLVTGYYSTTYLMPGYIDDLRITKGLARYTANFTPPTAALPTY